MFVVLAGNMVLTRMRGRSPIDTGNLRYRGISDAIMAGSNSIKFAVGGQNAPYGKTLNNIRVINNHMNRHYKWVEKIAESSAEEIARSIGGIVYNEGS